MTIATDFAPTADAAILARIGAIEARLDAVERHSSKCNAG